MNQSDENSWHIFQFYNAYRLLLIAAIVVFNPLRLSADSSNFIHLYLFFFCYALSILLFIYFTYQKRFRLVFLINLSIVCDLIYLNSLILIHGQWSLVAAIFIYVAIAMFSILLPGILPVFYAAIETIILLAHSITTYYLYNINTIYYAGVHGAGLFATAFTALVLAQWVKHSHKKAKEQEREISALHSINDYILHRLHSGVMLIDDDYNILMANNQAQQLFQTESANLKNLDTLSPELLNKVQQCHRGENSNRHAKVVNLKEPESIVHILPETEGKQKRTLIIFEDVVKTKQRAQEFKLASLGRFTASIAHELRNPLGAISHAAQLLQESTELNKEDRRLGEIIFSNCNRMNLLIRNILQLSRRQEAKRSLFSAKPFFDKIRKEALFYEKVELHIEVEPVDLKMNFDPSQLHQLMIILVENSIKHAASQHTKLCVNICVYTNHYGQVCLKISDNGKGVDEKDSDKIFEPFYTTSRQGVGLGLFIAKELCEANQAKMQYLGNNPGATFLITLVEGDVNYG